jgi:hypothetical protein
MSDNNTSWLSNERTVLIVLLFVTGIIIWRKESVGKFIDKFLEKQVQQDSKKEEVVNEPRLRDTIVTPSSNNSDEINEEKNQQKTIDIANKFLGNWTLVIHFENCTNTEKKYSDINLVTYSDVELSVDDNEIKGFGYKCLEKHETNIVTKFKQNKRDKITISAKIVDSEAKISGFIETIDNNGIKASIKLMDNINFLSNHISFTGDSKNCKYEIEFRRDLANPCEN